MMCVSLSPVYAGQVIVLDDQFTHRVGKSMEILVDEEKKLSIQDVADGPYRERFTPVDVDVPNLGITDAAIWVRFSVLNTSVEPRLKYLSFEFPLADYVAFFTREKDHFKRVNAGRTVGMTKKLIPSRYYVFPFRVDGSQQKTIYVRVISTTSMVFPMSIWEPGAFNRKDHRDQMFFGIIYGIWFAFICYFAFLSLKLRNPAAMWFTAYILCLGALLFSYQGYLKEFLPPFMEGSGRTVLLIVIGSLYFAGAKFFRTFVPIRYHSWKIDRAIQVLQWMGLGFIPMNIFSNPLTPLYSIVLAGVGPVFSIAVAVVFWIKKVPNAKYFTIGWMIGHITSELDLMRVFGIIPWTPEAIYLIPASMISCIVCFSIAVIEEGRKSREDASQDGLTGILNRRYFDNMLKIEWNRHLRTRSPLAVVIADIDNFKAFNDTYGHLKGDDCLKAIGRTFSRMLRRSGEIAARYGGEEFVALLPQTDAKQARSIAERIRRSIENLSIVHESSHTADVVTVSIGTASMIPEKIKTSAQLLNEADKALYDAKANGRNQVVSSDPL